MEKINTPMAIIIAGAIIAGALIVTGFVNSSGEQSTKTASDPKKVFTPVSEDDYLKGSRDAKVTLVEFSDLECPFCKNFHITLQSILDEYDAKEVAWVYRHAPLAQLHSKALYEANAAECAGELGGNNAFWAFTDRIFEITPSNNGLDLALIPGIAEAIGLNKEAFAECLEEGRHREKIDAHFQNAIATAQALGITRFGTPFSVLIDKKGNITPIQGAQSREAVKALIEEALR
ncbi:MAG: DsbA family protein [Candidatus Paceibacterota bacterium]